MPSHVGRRLDEGRAVYSLDDASADSAGFALPEDQKEGYDDASITCPDMEHWGYSQGYGPGGVACQEGPQYRDATTGAVLDRKL
eukprot:12577168-Alexandrium_andersonii.AAC.1